MNYFKTFFGLLFFLSSINYSYAGKTYVIGYNKGSNFHLGALPRVKAMYERAGLEVRFVEFPSIRSLRSADSGEIDGDMARIPSIIKYYQNLRRIDVPLVNLVGQAFALDNNIQTVDDKLLNASRVGAVRGVRWSENRLTGIKATYYIDNDTLFKMLVKGRLDIIMVTRTSASRLLEEWKEKGVEIKRLKPNQYTAITHHYVNKKNEEIIPKLERALKSLIDEGAW